MVYLQKLCAIAFSVLVAWVLFIYGAGEIQSDPAYMSTEAALMVASGEDQTPEASEKLALQALSKDPANGGAAAFLLERFVNSGKTEEASSAAELAARLWPVHVYTHSRLAEYWIAQNRVDKLIPELNVN